MFDRPARSRRAPFASILGTALLVAGIVVAALPTAVQAWSAKTYSSASEQQLFALTNQARASAGLRSLRWDSTLGGLARWRSKDMITRNYFSHNIPPSGQMVFEVMQARGYCFNVAGENIGWNQNYADDQATAAVQAAFMGSPGHRSNVLGKAWDVVGIGAYKGSNGKIMWTVIFADKCGGSAPRATPRPTPRRTPQPTARPTPASTPRRTPHPTPEPTRHPTPHPTVPASPTPGPSPSAQPTDSLEPPSPNPTPDASASAAAPSAAPTGEIAKQGLPAGTSMRVRVPAPSTGLVDGFLGGLVAFIFGN